MSTPGGKSGRAKGPIKERDLRRQWRRNPRDANAALLYSQSLQENGKHDQASRVRADLAILYAQRGEYHEAIQILHKLVALPPKDAILRHNLAALALNAGQTCEARGDIDNARNAYTIATRIDPGMLDARNELAALSYRLKDYELSERVYGEVLAVDHEDTAALTGLGALLNITGRYTEGLDLLTAVVVRNRPALILLRARILGNSGDTEQAIDLLNAFLESGNGTEEHRASALITSGKLYDARGQYDEAMACFIEGNTLKPNSFDPGQHRDLIDSIIDIYSTENLATLCRGHYGGPVPVFIVGMPRSGTTLVEQLLAGCDAVAAGGERDDMIAATLDWGGPGSNENQWPRIMNTVGEPELSRIGARYASSCQTDVQFFTDKMPPNFLFLGLIWQLFPNARVVHCIRHPMDTALSCFFQDFSAPLFDFCHDIEHLGAYYAQYVRLMQHWRDSLELPIFDLVYEDLVTEPEATGKQLFDFAGLEWKPDYLDLSSVDRVINTASHEQVRKNINTTSVKRYKNYSAHLDSFIRAGFDL